MRSDELNPAEVPPEARYRRNPRVARQVLGGRAVVLHYEGGRMAGFNETGTRVWERLDGRRTIAEIIDELAREDGVPVDEVAPAVRGFVADLLARELVVKAGGDPGGP